MSNAIGAVADAGRYRVSGVHPDMPAALNSEKEALYEEGPIKSTTTKASDDSFLV